MGWWSKDDEADRREMTLSRAWESANASILAIRDRLLSGQSVTVDQQIEVTNFLMAFGSDALISEWRAALLNVKPIDLYKLDIDPPEGMTEYIDPRTTGFLEEIGINVLSGAFGDDFSAKVFSTDWLKDLLKSVPWKAIGIAGAGLVGLVVFLKVKK